MSSYIDKIPSRNKGALRYMVCDHVSCTLRGPALTYESQSRLRRSAPYKGLRPLRRFAAIPYIERKAEKEGVALEFTLTNDMIHVATDWWGFGATLVAGILTAIATMAAVIYTNNQTKKQLKEQNIKFENERKEEFKRNKYVVIKPTLLLTSFTGLLDRLIVQNDYNRALLFSGADGFDFFDDRQKQAIQTCRVLLIENKTDIDISEIVITSKTTLRNMSNDALWTYNTSNSASFLRGRESIIIRIADQTQYEQLIAMNADKIPSALNFECRVEYSTLANQRITYIYEIEICNDRRIEVKKDGIESVVDLSEKVIITPTIFRNLQDVIAGVDRSAYSWEKMGQAQMRGIMSQYNPQSAEQSQTLNQESDTEPR